MFSKIASFIYAASSTKCSTYEPGLAREKKTIFKNPSIKLENPHLKVGFSLFSLDFSLNLILHNLKHLYHINPVLNSCLYLENKEEKPTNLKKWVLLVNPDMKKNIAYLVPLDKFRGRELSTQPPGHESNVADPDLAPIFFEFAFYWSSDP